MPKHERTYLIFPTLAPSSPEMCNQLCLRVKHTVIVLHVQPKPRSVPIHATQAKALEQLTQLPAEIS